jgi:hypothetical protein
MIFDGKGGEGVYGNKQQIHLYADLLKARTFLLRKGTGFFCLFNKRDVPACTERSLQF